MLKRQEMEWRMLTVSDRERKAARDAAVSRAADAFPADHGDQYPEVPGAPGNTGAGCGCNPEGDPLAHEIARGNITLDGQPLDSYVSDITFREDRLTQLFAKDSQIPRAHFWVTVQQDLAHDDDLMLMHRYDGDTDFFQVGTIDRNLRDLLVEEGLLDA